MLHLIYLILGQYQSVPTLVIKTIKNCYEKHTVVIYISVKEILSLNSLNSFIKAIKLLRSSQHFVIDIIHLQHTFITKDIIFARETSFLYQLHTII